MRRDKIAFWVAVAAIALVLISAAWILFRQIGGHTTVYIGDAVLNSEVVTTDSQRETGLSGRTSLAENKAMLFVFPSDQYWSIWMKGMRFNIDIVWLDAGKTVVHVEHNVSPGTFPATFGPPDPARYVLELAAGTAQKKGIQVGVKANFDINN